MQKTVDKCKKPPYNAHLLAGMAESVDAADSKSADGDIVRVRVSLPAPIFKKAQVSNTWAFFMPHALTRNQPNHVP